MSKNRQGELLMLGEAFLWSFFPIVTILTFSRLQPLITAAASALLSALFFAAILTFRKQWKQLLVRSVWGDILVSTLLVGILFYGLVFLGLKTTPAGDASILGLMQVFFTMLILGSWKKEHITKKRFLGGACMVLGAFLVLFKGAIQINLGAALILLSTTFPAVANYCMQQARKKVGPAVILFVRSAVSGLFFLAVALIVEGAPGADAINNSLGFLLLNGLVLLGLTKIFWVEAIHRIDISKATSLGAVSPVFTILFAYLILQEIPTGWQIMGLIPILIGLRLLISIKEEKRAISHSHAI